MLQSFSGGSHYAKIYSLIRRGAELELQLRALSDAVSAGVHVPVEVHLGPRYGSVVVELTSSADLGTVLLTQIRTELQIVLDQLEALGVPDPNFERARDV